MNTILLVGGRGKMGSAVARKLEQIDGYKIKVIDIDDDLNAENDADMIVDFASGKSSVVSAKFAVKKKIPLIVGSTGQSEAEEREILAAGAVVPVLKCSNFSVGIAKLKELISSVLKLDIQDIAVYEKHHREKKDSPSGTALELKKKIEENFDGDIQMLSERGGKEIGTHKLDFYFGSEVISISHQAFSREAFADGVVIAVKNLFNKPAGVYNFEHFVQNIQNKNVI